MVRSLGTFPLLDGFRGAPKVDVSALEEVILRGGRSRGQPSGRRRDGLQPGDGSPGRGGDRRRPSAGTGGAVDEAAGCPCRREPHRHPGPLATTKRGELDRRMRDLVGRVRQARLVAWIVVTS